ncbi:hypothetical protein BCD67_10450 [Oscillatoriales cyanobacterium USR001]|nr:hypothetical protein BCD67_10450 [Oscillatoriales cyanobacterium USR001]
MKLNSHRLTRLSSNLNQGFTMIELLVVTMIIGILSGVALPVFLAIINKAKSVEGMNNVRNLAQSQQNYYVGAGFFTDSLQELGSTLRTETDNYAYIIVSENNSLNGAVHVALSKKIGVKSYADVVYLKDGQPHHCTPVEIPLMYPPNSLSISLLLVNVISNPTRYCPR